MLTTARVDGDWGGPRRMWRRAVSCGCGRAQGIDNDWGGPRRRRRWQRGLGSTATRESQGGGGGGVVDGVRVDDSEGPRRWRRRCRG